MKVSVLTVCLFLLCTDLLVRLFVFSKCSMHCRNGDSVFFIFLCCVYFLRFSKCMMYLLSEPLYTCCQSLSQLWEKHYYNKQNKPQHAVWIEAPCSSLELNKQTSVLLWLGSLPYWIQFSDRKYQEPQLNR